MPDGRPNTVLRSRCDLSTRRRCLLPHVEDLFDMQKRGAASLAFTKKDFVSLIPFLFTHFREKKLLNIVRNM